MSQIDDSYLHHLRGLFDASGEKQHEKIYDFFPGIIYVYDTTDKKLRYVNKKITEVLGFSYDDLKLWDHDFSKVIFKDDVALVQQELEKFNALKDDDSHSYRCRFNRKEGDWLHFCVSGKILRRDAEGKVLSLLLVAQDVDREMRTSDELKVIRELAEDNEELLQFGNWNLNPATSVLKWSRGMYMLMDFDPEIQSPEITLEYFINHVVEQDRAPLLEAFDRAGKNKDTTVEYKYTVITTKQNEKIFYSKGKIIYDDLGAAKSIIGITRDITEPTRLYNNLDNYKRMVMEKEDFLEHGSWEFNLTDNSSNWSDGMYYLLGYDASIDKSHVKIDEALFLKHITTEALEKGKESLDMALASGSSFFCDMEIKNAKGEIRMLESYGKVIRNREGKPIQLIGTTRDVSKLKKYEIELENKIAQLDRSNKELEDFAYVASHDLQEPLRKIATLSERLQTKFATELQDDGKKYLDRIQQATKSARFLIDSLMEFSRISHKTDSVAVTDLNTLLQEVKADLEMTIEETQTSIISPKLPTLEVSGPQLKQLFTNIILNSIKFRKADHAPVITFTTHPASKAEIQQHHLASDKQYHFISIADNGIGFEEEYAHKIFQMFHRLHGKSEYPGAGIGLALCKKIVEHHGGIIWATGAPLKGAVFNIILPEKYR